MKTWTFLILAGFATLAHGAEMYRWTDDKGVVNYTPYPPPPNIKKVEQKKLGDTAAAPAAEAAGDVPYAVQLAVKNFPVTFYATPDCGDPCKQARAHLQKRGVPNAEKNPAKPASNQEWEAYKKMTGGSLDVPLLQIGQLKLIKGYQASEYDAALDAAGYPTSGTGVKPGAKPPATTPPGAKSEPTPPAAAK